MASPDISTDFLGFDNLETVQYASRTAESAYASPVAVANVQREPLQEEYLTAGSLLPRVTVYWNFWSAVLVPLSLTPKQGDQFADQDGYNWQVLSVESSRWRTSWRVNALRMR